MAPSTRRRFLRHSAIASAAACLAPREHAPGQDPGARPRRAAGVTVLNPRGRVPVSLIVDDSTCLVNLNKFAIPQFAEVNPGRYDHYNWREWPDEIPDSFVRKFGEWAAGAGVKGKFSVVPFPACVGRVDRTLPGWTQGELAASLELVRTTIMPNWDIHPEMVTHTRIIDPATGHPVPEFSLRFMENWDWTTGRSADEIAAYLGYALSILKNAGLPCEGVTTPGGFGSRARPALSQAVMDSCRDVFKTEIPHYFRDLYSEGDRSVAPRVEGARDLEGDDPRCVVSIVGCTGDWTGGWDNTLPGGADKFITPDGEHGRMVDVITRGEPAVMVCHWTGIHFNGRELGLEIFQEVVRRLHQRFPRAIHWMKLSEIARYWAAKELTAIEVGADRRSVTLRAPFACPGFTLEVETTAGGPPVVEARGTSGPLAEAAADGLGPGTWHRAGDRTRLCFDLPKGVTILRFG
jgi:hypothetical protein